MCVPASGTAEQRVTVATEDFFSPLRCQIRQDSSSVDHGQQGCVGLGTPDRSTSSPGPGVCNSFFLKTWETPDQID